MSKERIILGIDPGTTIMGYGIIQVTNKRIKLITMGVIHLKKYDNHAQKLKKIYQRTVEIIHSFTPDELAIEAPFYGKNVQSMLKLGRAQGIAIAAALQHDMPFVEYAPKKIKQSITGNGNASKEQVAAMLPSLIGEPVPDKTLDATDALAVALCHYYQNGTDITQKSFSNWKSFLSSNPKRRLT